MYLERWAADAAPVPVAHVTPAPGQRPLAARMLGGALSAAWARGLFERPELYADALIARALAATGLDDFGAPGWREPFEALLADLRGPARLNAIGMTIAAGQLTKALRDRLRLTALHGAHPEIASIAIPAPIIVLGSMRSGTTRIQRLLACDPRLDHTRLFESLSPVASPGLDLRAAKTRAMLGLFHRLEPRLAQIHPTGAGLADEEIGLLGLSFSGAQFEAQWRVPGFARWWRDADPAPAYREFKRALQAIAWHRGHPARPWVLKLPQFMEDLDAVLATFPDARLLCLGRDPVAVVGSSASLVSRQMQVQSDHVDLHWIGREWLGKTVRRVERARDTRARHPGVPQLEIAYADVDRDWRSEMRRVYRFLGLALTPAVEQCMARYLAQAHRHRGHRYSAEQFGLDPAAIRRALPHGA